MMSLPGSRLGDAGRPTKPISLRQSEDPITSRAQLSIMTTPSVSRETWNCEPCDVQRGAWTKSPAPEKETQRHDCCHANMLTDSRLRAVSMATLKGSKGQSASTVLLCWCLGAPCWSHTQHTSSVHKRVPPCGVPMATSWIQHWVSVGQCYWYRNMID